MTAAVARALSNSRTPVAPPCLGARHADRHSGDTVTELLVDLLLQAVFGRRSPGNSRLEERLDCAVLPPVVARTPAGRFSIPLLACHAKLSPFPNTGLVARCPRSPDVLTLSLIHI